jgi:uncharacterized protein (DUF302 family)
MSYVLRTTTAHTYDEAVEATRKALAAEDFGVLTEIDVAATLKKKLGVDRDPYLILGACSPPVAHQALEAEADLGALLPCNVVVSVEDGITTVFAVDPEKLLAVSGNPRLGPFAHDIHHRLQRAIDRVGAC